MQLIPLFEYGRVISNLWRDRFKITILKTLNILSNKIFDYNKLSLF